MLKIDLHTHILPKDWPNLRERYGYGGFIQMEHHTPCKARMMLDGKLFREVEENCWDPHVRMRESEVHHTQVQVLSTVPVMFCYWAKPEDTLDLSKRLNDHIAGIVAEHPKRFAGLATLPMQSPKLAIQELERCQKELGFSGIQIGSHINDWELNAPEVVEVLTAAADLGAMVFVHPWDMVGKERMQKYWLPWLVGMPTESTLAICSVIFGGVLERLPKLKICFAHGGGSFFGTLGRIEHGFAARPDLVAVDNKRSPRDYVGKFYVDALVHDAAMLKHIVDTAGANHVAMGTDYPFPLGEQVPGALIESLNLSPQETERLLSGTALELLGKDRSAFL